MRRRRPHGDPWRLVALMAAFGIVALWFGWWTPTWREHAAVTTTTLDDRHVLELPRILAPPSRESGCVACAPCPDDVTTTTLAPPPAKVPQCKPADTDATYRSHVAWLARHPWREVRDGVWTNGMQTAMCR